MTAPDRRNFMKSAAGAAAAFAIQPEWAIVPRLGAPLSIGLVGAGRQGRAILSELAKFEDVNVAALCDTDASRRSSGARRAPSAKPFETHTDLLSDGKVDAVIVATPTHTHATIAVDALSAGKHVYCEAPLAHSQADCERIAQAARTAKTVFQTGLQGRSNPVYKLARSFVRSGAIGDVVGMRAQYNKKGSWRTPAGDPERERALNWRLDSERSQGLFGEFGTQQFDVWHWFTSKYPTEVNAHGSVLAWQDGRTMHDTVAGSFSFPGGVQAAYSATLANSYEGEFELLLGTMGSVKLSWTHGWMFKEADAPTQGWEVYANRQRFHNDEGITLIADATKLSAQGKLKEGVGLPHAPLYYALEAFLKSATEDKDIVCTADEGVRAALVGIAGQQAALTGATQAIELGERAR